MQLKKRLLVPLLASLALPTAVYSISEVQKANLFKNMGWMDATCFFYNQGYLPKKEAELSIQAVLKIIEDNISLEQSNRAKTLFLKKSPDCSSIIP